MNNSLVLLDMPRALVSGGDDRDLTLEPRAMP